MNREDAEALVAGWKADCYEAAISFLDPYRKGKLRPVIAARNVLANDALWEGKFGTATNLFMRYGLNDRRPDGRRAAASSARRFNKISKVRQRLTSEALGQNARRAWSTCKPRNN